MALTAKVEPEYLEITNISPSLQMRTWESYLTFLRTADTHLAESCFESLVRRKITKFFKNSSDVPL